MSGWAEFGLAFAMFLIAHLIPVRPGFRPRLVGLMGERAYLAVYALVSLILLAWLIGSAGRAPYVSLWTFEPWHAWVVALVMVPVCLLTALGLGVPNPFSFGGGDAAQFDPGRPRIVGVTRHPLLWALALWSGAHLVANGDLAHLLLFGGLLAMAMAGMAALDRRSRRRLAVRSVTGWRAADLFRVAVSILIYTALLLAHERVIGVSPLAMLYLS